MIFKRIVVALVVCGWNISAFAADPIGSTHTLNATTISASTVISPGAYVTSISPSINGSMAERLVKAIKLVPGVGPVTSNTETSTLRFTVKNGSEVHEVDIQRAVAKADTGAVMSEPILEHSLSANPGL